MEKLRTILIDDEKSNREFLQVLLADHCPDVELVGTADGVESGLELIQEVQPDLVFLDIQMPTGTGFDLLEQVKEADFEVVFVTAYDQYAIRAFRYSAVDYLLKPLDPDDLVLAVQRATRARLQEHGNDRLSGLLDNLKNLTGLPGKLIVPDQSGFEVLELEEIIRAEAERNYTTFVLVSGRKVVSSKPIGHYEEMLQDRSFVRIHNSHLVNLRHLQRYTKGRGGLVVMSDGEELEVSRRKRDDFLKRISEM